MKNIEVLREKLKLSQLGLAMKIGVSQSSIAKWETGRNKPTADKLMKLADFFFFFLDEILREDGETHGARN